MPKAQSTDARIAELRKLSGQDFAMKTAADMLLMQPAEQDKALRILSALHATVARETQSQGSVQR